MKTLAACAAVGLLCLARLGNAQPLMPTSAQVLMYFPQLADGGPRAGQWQTKLTFVNTNTSTANVTVNFYADTGSPLSLNFGNGTSSQFSFTVPSGASRVFRSNIGTSTTIVGWALAYSSLPVLGNISFRQINNGTPSVEITSNPTLPTHGYVSAATPALGIAVANRYSDSAVSVLASAYDYDGNAVGQQAISIPPLGHLAFNLSDKIPSLPSNFVGTVVLTGKGPFDTFVAWTLSADSGTLSSLPEGRAVTPISQWDAIWLAFSRVHAAAKSAIGSPSVNLEINATPIINAHAGNNTVTIYEALAELISDSPSELAFTLAHELGHIYQQRTGKYLFHPNAEFDADSWGLVFSLTAGYDPYGAAGALAKLAMATGQAGLLAQFEDQLSSDAHKSFNERLTGIYQMISAICSFDAEKRSACDAYKIANHPHFPPIIPLSVPRTSP